MKSTSAGLFNIIMKFFSWMLIVFMLICACSPFIHPKYLWFIGFLSLLFPYIFFLVLLFLIYWLFKFSRFFIYPFFALILSAYSLQFNFSFHQPNSFVKEKDKQHLRVMSWNIRHFIPYNESNFKPVNKDQIEKVFDEVLFNNPDIVCFQEFISLPNLGTQNPFHQL
ncbi:MAG: hypothetical protein ACO3B0_01280, partial [Chitinophagaceae bacterium]